MTPSTQKNLERFSNYWYAPFCCVCLGCCAAEFGRSGGTYELPCTVQCVRLQMIPYCYAVLHFARGSRRETKQWYWCCLCGHCLALCLNTSSDTDVACVAIALTLCLKRKKESLLDQTMVQKKTTHTHTHNLTKVLRLSEPKDYKICLR